LADLLLQGPGKLSPKQYRDRCAELGRDCDEQERLLGLRSAAYAAAQRSRRATLADLAQVLPDESALIEFVGYLRWNFVSRKWAQPQYLALVLWRPNKNMEGVEREVRLVSLGPAAPLDAAIAAWRDLARRGRTDETVEQRLRHILWEPLAKVLPQ